MISAARAGIAITPQQRSPRVTSSAPDPLQPGRDNSREGACNNHTIEGCPSRPNTTVVLGRQRNERLSVSQSSFYGMDDYIPVLPHFSNPHLGPRARPCLASAVTPGATKPGTHSTAPPSHSRNVPALFSVRAVAKHCSHAHQHSLRITAMLTEEWGTSTLAYLLHDHVSDCGVVVLRIILRQSPGLQEGQV